MFNSNFNIKFKMLINSYLIYFNASSFVVTNL